MLKVFYQSLSLLVILIPLFASPISSQSIFTIEGNVAILTSTERDYDPSLSPDGTKVVFVRSTPELLVEGPTGYKHEATELWIMDLKTKHSRMLLRGKETQEPTNLLCNFHNPQFSPDGNKIYFQSTAWVTSDAIHVINLQSGIHRFLTDGNSLEVIRKGEYEGYLIVQKHKYFMSGGSYDWYWLVSPEGKEIAPVGRDADGIKQFMKINEVRGLETEGHILTLTKSL